MCLIEDKQIFYLVLNTKHNQIDQEFIDSILKLLDEVEVKAKGKEAVLVTIGTGTTTFCSGFDLKYWALNPMNMLLTIIGMQKVFARLISLGIPSLAVLNGHTIAAGVFLALCHDKIIMKADPKKSIWVNELTFGKAVPYAYL